MYLPPPLRPGNALKRKAVYGVTSSGLRFSESKMMGPLSDRSEAEILASVTEYLRKSGWLVIVTSQDKATRHQIAGLPDRIAIKHDRVLFIEGKAKKGQLRPSQKIFAFALSPHLGDHVIYLVARSLDDVVEAIREEI